jgi:Trypsin-like peptidase domain
MDEHREFYSLHLPQLINYVVPVVQKKRELKVGSGVLVRAGDRHFIATAKHCIDADKVRVVRSDIPLGPQGSGTSDARELRILGKSWHDRLDLGFLEIADPECAELGWDQLCTDKITGGRVHIVGYPQVLTIPTERFPGKLTDISLCAGAFGTCVKEESDDRMILDYPRVGMKYDETTGEWHESSFPKTPEGFSGGACFGVAKPPGAIARLEYNLLAIQYAWNELDSVFAVPIKRWRELLVDRGMLKP